MKTNEELESLRPKELMDYALELHKVIDEQKKLLGAVTLSKEGIDDDLVLKFIVAVIEETNKYRTVARMQKIYEGEE